MIVTTMCEVFQAAVSANPEAIALRTKGGDVEISWREYAQRVQDLATGLASLGLKRGDTLALMLTNRPEFHLVDTAGMHLGATGLSIYNTSAPEQIAYIIQDCGARVLVTETQFLPSIRAAGLNLDYLIVIDGQTEGALSLQDLAIRGDASFDFRKAWQAVCADDVLTIIYTSGTTGVPKGVELTHSNLCAHTSALAEAFDVRPGGRMVSYFPMAHIAERNTTHYFAMATTSTVTCCPDASKVASYFQEVHPTGLFAAPRIWEKLKAELESRIQAMTGPEGDSLRRALIVGLEVVRARRTGAEIPDKLRAEHERLTRESVSALLQEFGLDQVEWATTGAAPTPTEILEFFHALGVNVGEVWGLSETSGAVTANRPNQVRIGTQGRLLRGLEARIDLDGEILVRGATVTRGYRNAPDKTDAAFDDGWFRTGDIGAFDDEGHLCLFDRKKDILINATGKNMSPATIEARIKTSSEVIGHCVAIGDGRPYVVALITLDRIGVERFARANGIERDSFAEYAMEEAVLNEVAQAIERGNRRLSRAEQIRRHRVLDADWDGGAEEVTLTMKLRRKIIAEKYADEIDALYNSR